VSRRANTIRSIISCNQPVITTVLFFSSFIFAHIFTWPPGKVYFICSGSSAHKGRGKFHTKVGAEFKSEILYFVVVGCRRWLLVVVVGGVGVLLLVLHYYSFPIFALSQRATLI